MEKIKENGLNITVVSNKFDAGVKKLCKYYFDDIIDVAVGSTDDMPRKPAPDMVFKAMEQLTESRSNIKAIYIGDSEVDVKTAENAGLPCISCLWGFRNRDQLNSAGARVFAISHDVVWDLIRE